MSDLVERVAIMLADNEETSMYYCARVAIAEVFDWLVQGLSDDAIQAAVGAWSNPRDVFAAILAVRRREALGDEKPFTHSPDR